MSPRNDSMAIGAEVLFADDEPAMREMVADLLAAAGFRVRLAPDGASALMAVLQRRPDLIILDNRMGRPTGFEVCEQLKEDPSLEFIPVLLLTGEGDLENRVLGFRYGADDFLAKPFEPRELVARCRALLRQARRGLDRNPTSGLPGGEALRREFERRAERCEPFCLCYLDLDYFKPFNDHFGFVAADQAIRDAGHAVLQAASEGGFAGHVGGDDFVLFSQPAVARARVQEAQALFDAQLQSIVPPEVRARGWYTAEDRDGRVREIPLTRLSAAIVYVDPAYAGSLSDFSVAIARTKRRAKSEESGIAELLLSGVE